MKPEYIERAAAVADADYATDEHPYDKDPKRPDTYSPYNEGWTDACNFIRARLEVLPAADVAPVVHGWWNRPIISWAKRKNPFCYCTNCACPVQPKRMSKYCPNCGAKMDGGIADG